MEALRLRLNGAEGSGFCVFAQREQELHFRFTVEGPSGGMLELWAQGRSPHLEQGFVLARCGDFSGLWEAEGHLPARELGWLWLLRNGRVWLDGAFPGVLISREDALAHFHLPGSGPQPLLPLAGDWQALGGGTWGWGAYRLCVGEPETPPPRAQVYLAGERENYWLWKEENL